jgi:cellulose synthase/poly-beta-1,6-N-acetylglucosamine synthase-like glycosyltransferase
LCFDARGDRLEACHQEFTNAKCRTGGALVTPRPPAYEFVVVAWRNANGFRYRRRVRVVEVAPDDMQARLERSAGGLAAVAPELTAMTVLDRRQRQVLIWTGIVVLAALVLAPLDTSIVLVAIATVFYVAAIGQRVLVTARSRRSFAVLNISAEDARAVEDDALPTFSVLVPVYREAEVLPHLIEHLDALEYPADKIEVLILLEADDFETIDAARSLPGGDGIQLILVPPGEPRTKPRALNYGMTFATGDIITVYDAEDAPEPLQLRRAAVAFDRLPDDVACMQAKLTFHNADQNIITRWFTIEYLMWFSMFLPGLSLMDAPVPLGGTSNHMRRDVLESLGGWDAYNVTEDADLGVRLHRRGWRTAVLESETMEEGNSDFVNWMKQRSRWYKGYLTTWLVHLRHPVELERALGPSGFAQFNLFIGGTPILALLNPIFWGLTLLWFVGHIGVIQLLYPAPVYYLGLFCFVFGNVSIYYLTVVAARTANRPMLVLAAALVPVYWVMMSVAAAKAFWQLIVAPSFWEKTTHGLDVRPAEAEANDPALVGREVA